jgi:hypothetical protein
MFELNWQLIIFFVLLVDSLGAVLLAWFGQSVWSKFFSPVARFFPIAKGWAALYLVLVLFIGYLLGVFN